MFTCFKSPTAKPLAIMNEQNSVTTDQIADVYTDMAAIKADVREKIDGVWSAIDDMRATQRDLGDAIKKNKDDASIVQRSFRCSQDAMTLRVDSGAVRLAVITNKQDEQRTGLDIVNGKQDAMTLRVDSIERKQDEVRDELISVNRKVNRWTRSTDVTNAIDCCSDQPLVSQMASARPFATPTPPPPTPISSELPRPPPCAPPTRPTPPTTPGDPTTEYEYQCGYCSPRTQVDGVVIDDTIAELWLTDDDTITDRNDHRQHFVNICERDHRLLGLNEENGQKYNAALGNAMQHFSMTTMETTAGVSTFACLICSKQVDGTRNAISHAVRHVQKGQLDKLNVEIGAALIREFWK